MAMTSSEADKVIKAFLEVYQRKYTAERFNLGWKVHAKKCYRHMNKVAKGSYCAICDIEEHSRFSNQDIFNVQKTAEAVAQRLLQAEKKVKKFPNEVTNAYLSPADAFAFSNNCSDYLEEHVELLKHVQRFKTVLTYRGSHYKRKS